MWYHTYTTCCYCLAGLIITVQSNPATNNHNGGEIQNGIPPEKYDSVAYCDPYCDMYGYYQPGKWCVSQDSSVEVYCCGNEFTRYCCADPDKDVGDLYPSVSSCPKSSWWHYQGDVVLGLLSTLVVMLLLAACCYYCCGGSRAQHFASSRGSLFSIRRRTHPDEEMPPREDTTFNPESPYAFQPPDYSLPKDPPKYNDIISGVTNTAFENNESHPQANCDNPQPSTSTSDSTTASNEVAAETPPPVYEEIDPLAAGATYEEISSLGVGATSNESQGLAAVHGNSRLPVSVDERATGIIMSQTGIGMTQLNNESLTNVENSLPPYEEMSRDSSACESGRENPNNNNADNNGN